MKLKTIFINFIILIGILLILEVSTRIALYFYRADADAGMAGRNSNLVYQPFVMFGDDYNKKVKYFNAKESDYNILILGGSTAQLWSNEIIFNQFENYFADENLKIFNSAYSGYNSRQELIFFTIWGRYIKPDLVISLDGANDIINGLRKQKIGSFFPNSSYELLLLRPYLGPLVFILQHSQFYNSILRVFARFEKFEIEDYIENIDIYIESQRNISEISEIYNAKHISILQPYAGFKKTKHEEEIKNFSHYIYRDKLVKELYELTDEKMRDLHKNTKSIYIDSRGFYDEYEVEIFADDVHFISDEGYKILTNKIIEELGKSKFKN